ncbi:MAG: hypothetical protein ACLTAO_12720, partial [Christensenellales bacterium]
MHENTKANVFDVYLLKNTCEQRINYYVGRNFKENAFSEQFKADNRYSLLKNALGTGGSRSGITTVGRISRRRDKMDNKVYL